MPSTYTNNLGIELPADGEQDGIWGDVVNDNMNILDRAINGSVVLSLSGTTSTLTTSNGTLSNGQYKALILGGTPSGTHTITISPNDAQKIYYVYNLSGQSVVFTQGSGTNVTIANGDTGIIYSDGGGGAAGVVNLTDNFAMNSVKITGGTITGITDLAVADGGTGASDVSTARTNLGLAIGTNVQAWDANLDQIAALAPTADNFIVGNGSAWTLETPANALTSLGLTATAAELNFTDGVTSSIQTQLDAKAPLVSPALTGTPTAPTATTGTNTTQVATTAFVNAEIANDAPSKTGTGASGTWGISITGTAATDTSRAPLASPAFTGTPTAPTATNGTSTTQIATTAFVQSAISAGVPSGFIGLWSGSAASIPSGWLLCNGTSGTPDLRDRFVVGAGSTYAVGATGGAATITLSTSDIPSHTHTFSATTSTDGSHDHDMFFEAGSEASGSYTNLNGFLVPINDNLYGNITNTSAVQSAGSHSHTVSGTTAAAGSGGAHENRPPYYALCYIMKS